MTARAILSAAAAVAAAGIAVALALQHLFGMQPCPWCALQRLIVILLALVFALAAVLPGRAARVGSAAVGVLLACGGVGAALYQHFVASLSNDCGLTLADRILMVFSLQERLPWVFMPTGGCADASVALLGVPLPVWGAALFALLGAMGLAALGRLRAVAA